MLSNISTPNYCTECGKLLYSKEEYAIHIDYGTMCNNCYSYVENFDLFNFKCKNKVVSTSKAI